MGGSQSREQLEKVRAELDSTKSKANALAAERDSLKSTLSSQAAELERARTALASAASDAAAQLESKDAALNKALKQKQMAEELRRSDALLAKRLMHAQLRHLGGQPLPTTLGSGSDNAEERWQQTSRSPRRTRCSSAKC